MSQTMEGGRPSGTEKHGHLNPLQRLDNMTSYFKGFQNIPDDFRAQFTQEVLSQAMVDLGLVEVPLQPAFQEDRGLSYEEAA